MEINTTLLILAVTCSVISVVCIGFSVWAIRTSRRSTAVDRVKRLTLAGRYRDAARLAVRSIVVGNYPANDFELDFSKRVLQRNCMLVDAIVEFWSQSPSHPATVMLHKLRSSLNTLSNRLETFVSPVDAEKLEEMKLLWWQSVRETMEAKINLLHLINQGAVPDIGAK